MREFTLLEILLAIGALMAFILIMKARYEEVKKNRPDRH